MEAVKETEEVVRDVVVAIDVTILKDILDTTVVYTEDILTVLGETALEVSVGTIFDEDISTLVLVLSKEVVTTTK